MLAIVRTSTSLNRLLDVLPVFADDSRVHVLFTVDKGSVFHRGVEERLISADARAIDWEDALATRFDLALSASDKGDLHRIQAPLMLLLHGVGYHRFTDAADNRGREIAGLTGSVRIHTNRTMPSVLVIAHPNQVRSLERLSTHAAASALVAGDPCLDRILASRSQQARYRAVFGADDRRLVLLNSTWGAHSLLGRHPELPARLLAELPADEYRVAAVLHPNVWSRHGHWQVRAWLSRAVDAGLILVPPEEGWRAAMIAAQVVISDHGSITCYAAALDKPLLLGADGANEVVPDSPLDLLSDIVPRLNHDAPLLNQIREVVRAHEPNRYGRISAAMFSGLGESMPVLQAEMYRLLRLPLPPRPAHSSAVPVPAVALREPASFVVHTTITRTGSSATVAVQRFPAVLGQEPPPGSVHLAVDDAESDERLAESAAIIMCRTRSLSESAASAWSDNALARYPGSRIAAVVWMDRAAVRLRDGIDVGVRLVRETARVDPLVCVSAVYACRLAGMVLADLRTVNVRIGAVMATARLDVTSVQPGR